MPAYVEETQAANGSKKRPRWKFLVRLAAIVLGSLVGFLDERKANKKPRKPPVEEGQVD